MDKLLADIQHLPQVSEQAATIYEALSDALVKQVDASLEARADIRELTGRNPLALMRQNHAHHAQFMAAVFRLNAFDLLAKTLPWVYRVYRGKGFSYDYFPVQLAAWQAAIRKHLAPDRERQEILAIYEWMARQHEEVIRCAAEGSGFSFANQRELPTLQQLFLSLLLSGDSRGCLALAEKSLQQPADLKTFYEDVVGPALYDVGRLWETNSISAADEHLATAIVNRVMAGVYPRFARLDPSKGRAVVATVTNELHEMGARMAADCLEMDGWDVSYLGANVPAADLAALLRRQQPFVVALSVSMSFNLHRAEQMIATLKSDADTRGVKILIGGLALREAPDLWRRLGADAYAPNLGAVLRICDDWWQAAA